MSEFESHANDPSARRDPLAQAVHDVVIPDGLQSRLLKALREQRAHAYVSTKRPGHRSWSTRRTWMAGVTSACLGGTLAGYAWLRRDLELDEIVTLASGWLGREWDWQPMPEKADASLRLPRIVRVPAQGHERFTSRLSCRTIAYDVSTPIPREPDTNAILFAVTTWRTMTSIPTAAPRMLTPTGRWQLAVWRDRSCLYVLAWTGPAPARRIRTLLDSHEAVPLA